MMTAFTLSASFTSVALTTTQGGGGGGNSDWPLVSIPHFDARLTGVLEASGAQQVRLQPLRSTFEEYAVAQQLLDCSSCPTVSDIMDPTTGDPVDTREPVTVPLWQVAPFTTEPLVMQNLLGTAVMAQAIRRMQDLGAGVLTDIIIDTSDASASSSSSTSDDGSPLVVLLFPVFADFQQITMASMPSVWSFNGPISWSELCPLMSSCLLLMMMMTMMMTMRRTFPFSWNRVREPFCRFPFKNHKNHGGDMNNVSSPPIADLFPNTTVLFADIAGFTAWSSQREPPQVFTLLETLYRSFDVIAKKLKVFKVETIGDCYMAVTGLPNPDDAHAVHDMSRFGYQCLVGMKELLKELEAVLGPGTSDLALRVGLHSGAVTAGVLRGEKSRFRLFGDTVNTASRMESTDLRGKIQMSQETADLLMAAGKSHWLKSRDEAVVAKGKGELKTYWLDPTKKRRNTKSGGGGKEIKVAPEININGGNNSVDKSMSPGDVPFDDKYARLIDWNVDVLLHHLARVISSRSRNPARGSLVNHSSEVALLPAAINDVAEVVALPPFDPDASRFRRARPDVSVLQQTRADLHEYVKRIAVHYRDVPFHNFEHASHVTLCANKLMNRLINSDEYGTEEELHNATFGISSDPLTHFAIVFAALIHDVDHTGLPNAQLVKDGNELAVKLNNRSVAEQNSVHLGWEMLMDPRFERLRKCIYQTNVERKRFRQLVINAVLATDIADRNVNEDRQSKWERAFQSKNKMAASSGGSPLQMQEDMKRKGPAVIEYIIQVSDVAHTMQHWHIYRRWNERLFHEMHDAFYTGKVSVDPSTNWYIGELGFLDYYLIPLAMKLKECGVFGASGYEYISYVLKNKKEWERKGRQVVQEMVLL